MSTRPEDLPEFSAPPVVEVVLGLQFEPIRGFRQAHFGMYWEMIREDYPLTVDHGRLETRVEPLEGKRPGPTFQVEMLDSPPTHRTWFMSDDDERLIQLQDDRFIHNWRHRGGPYPRFERLKEQFWAAFQALGETIDRLELDRPRPRQVEVSYINWIDEHPETFLRPAGESSIDVEGVGPQPELQQWLGRYSVHSDGVQVGRLTIESKPGARRADDRMETGHLLSLTYLAPLAAHSDPDTADEHFARGRDAIVRSFAAITDESMHAGDHWGRIR